MISCSRVSRLVLWIFFGDNECEFSEIFRFKYYTFLGALLSCVAIIRLIVFYVSPISRVELRKVENC